MLETSNNIWIVGYGDIGRRLGIIYKQQGMRARVTTRSHNAQLDGHKTYPLELDKEFAPLKGLGDADLFYFIPPPKIGKQDLRLRSFLRNMSIPARRIVLISTTGVYGNCDGEWVDETRVVQPIADRAYRRVDAEQQLVEWAKDNHCDTTILRVPGIYAVDRLPLARLKKGLAIVKESESPWTNRIHADDLAMICYQVMQSMKDIQKPASAQNELIAEIFNISDGSPSTMAEYFNAVADYAGLSRPPQISLKQAEKELSKGMMSYMKESRRISNKKMLDKLAIKLRYPSLKDGLKKHT